MNDILLRCLVLVVTLQALRAEGDRCLTNRAVPVPRSIYYNEQSLDLTVRISNQITHRMVTEILRIVCEEILGYKKVKFVTEINHYNMSQMYQNIFESRGNISENIISVPTFMINLEMSLSPDADYKIFFNNYALTDCGSIAPPGRYGWFIPEQLYQIFPNTDHWRYFRSLNNAQLFDINREDDIRLLQKYSFNNASQKYICDTDYCSNGYFIPSVCKKNESCSVLLTSYPETTYFIVRHIIDLKLYVKVLWLGKNLRYVVDKLTNVYISQSVQKSIVFLEWTPGYFTTGKDKLVPISMPNCDYFKSASSLGCKYELTQNVKMVWSELKNIAGPAFETIHKMKFNKTTYESLLESIKQYDNVSLTSAACSWMRTNEEVWSKWLPSNSDVRELILGGIFPITGSLYNAKGIVLAAKMARDAINNNSTILRDYKLTLIVNNGECRADMVMKTFIDYIYHNTYKNLIGVLGPACSETVEPLAGVSKYYKTVVISYSAEGSSFSDRTKYPYFFRTIGENEHYNVVYLHLFKEFNWNRLAAFTEDGQKYTEYISSMEHLLQTQDIHFITNIKFPRNSKEALLTRYLEDLKEKRAKIIIADIYDGVARIVMCQAYKLEMTAKQGYVWFLPAWLPQKWYNTTHYNKYFNESVDCSIDMMREAINGHFSMNHAAYGPGDSIMQENITIDAWRAKYNAEAAKFMSAPSETISNEITSDYSAYAYDAVWVYALAIEELLTKNPESLSAIHSAKTTANLVNNIRKIDINGVSGRVKFYNGPSRVSIVNIIQWQNETSVIIGSFYPNITNSEQYLLDGILQLNKSSIIWLTPDNVIPDDGSVEPEKCFFEPLAVFLNITCGEAMILVNIVCFAALSVLLFIMVVCIKRRYDKKIRLTEEYMKAIGLDKNGGINLTNLDKWETARECVVINRKLGEGAFGTVYGGEAILTQSKGWVAVAVKTLKVGSNREEKLDFLSEAESMKRFEHKNIVKLLGVCTKNEPLYTIMEFMLYGDLKTYLLARRHLINEPYTEEKEEISSKKLTSMALDVAHALSYLAELKYVHRDVACRNCLVNSQRVIKLGDFGMTRLIFENDYYRFSRKGMLPVRWMAPESLGLGIFTPSSDVWSFAILLYEIITFGSFPFQGMSNSEVLEHVKNGHTLTIPKGVKPQLEGLMRSCWNLDYKTRPHASEIAEFLANSPRLLSPCLDVPLASVEMDFSYDINPVPESSNKYTNSGELEVTGTLFDTLKFDNPSYLTADTPPNKQKRNKYTFENRLGDNNRNNVEENTPFV